MDSKRVESKLSSWLEKSKSRTSHYSGILVIFFFCKCFCILDGLPIFSSYKFILFAICPTSIPNSRIGLTMTRYREKIMIPTRCKETKHKGVWSGQYDVIMFDSSPRLLYWPKQRQILRAFNPSRCHWLDAFVGSWPTCTINLEWYLLHALYAFITRQI